MHAKTGNVQRGFSLIELSVATAIFSMGLGSLSLMMLAAIQGTVEARHQTLATSQVEAMAEMIAMSSDAFGHSVFPDQGIQAEAMADWRSYLGEELPGGDGLVCRDSTPDDGDRTDPSCDGNGPLVIKVFWQETRHSKSEHGDLRRLVSRLP